jgi:EamA domain-containing membrane protein RarD
MIVYATGNWQQPSSVTVKNWLFLVLSGAATGASWICYFRALKLGDASRVAPIDKLSVVFVAVFAMLFLGERLAPPNWLGVILIACGRGAGGIQGGGGSIAGAANRTRTCDPVITNDVLYQLSYCGEPESASGRGAENART